MKKLIIALGAVAVAAGLQAATVSWQSGALYTAANANGGWSTTLVNNANPQALVTMSVYLVDEATYGSLTAAGKTSADIYEWAGKQASATYTGQNKNASTGAIIGAATVNVANTLDASKTYYSIVTAEYTDDKYGDMYMAAAGTVTTTAAGAGSFANIFGGASTATVGGIRNWAPAAVPEPTSGLLMLIGMAGLALRRRRA